MAHMKPFRRITALAGIGVMLLTWHGRGLTESVPQREVGSFSTQKAGNPLPEHWEPLYFENIDQHTDYRLVDEGGQVVVKATADASASGLIRKIAIDPGQYPIVQWRWKAANVLKKGSVCKKDGDDYPARLYILFKYDPARLGFLEKIKYETVKLFYGDYPPLASISYIWASNAPAGLVVPNPYTDRSMMVVVQSGEKNLDRWLTEERNIYRDYRTAFKDEPPMISGVAIMTDTDNTGESATAWYGDIVFRKDRKESVRDKTN